VRARKIGLTSKVMQDAVGITEPDHGVIYDDMFYAHGDTIPFDRFIAPRLEVELAFVLGRDLAGPGCTLDDVLDATDYVTPAIEILDARIQMKDPDTGSTRTIVDTVSDNAADAGIVVGRAALRCPRARPAVGVRRAAPQRRDRGVGCGRCGARSSGHRGRLAGRPARRPEV
jgi:2-oxo-hept-3-ene-1,7-dioate hydratase